MNGDTDGLLSRLRIVEEQDLAERADAYASLHEELAARLEASPGSSAMRPSESRPTAPAAPGARPS